MAVVPFFVKYLSKLLLQFLSSTAKRLLTPRMCGVGDAITTGTNADTGTNPDREYSVEIAARPRRPYHAFVSAWSSCFAALSQFSRVDSCDGNATLCQDFLPHTRCSKFSQVV